MARRDRVTVKVATLRELERLISAGSGVAALEVLREVLDFDRQAELQRCKAAAYAGFRSGRFSYEEYRELWGLADGAMR